MNACTYSTDLWLLKKYLLIVKCRQFAVRHKYDTGNNMYGNVVFVCNTVF